jgi:hypothetical protein
VSYLKIILVGIKDFFRFWGYLFLLLLVTNLSIYGCGLLISLVGHLYDVDIPGVICQITGFVVVAIPVAVMLEIDEIKHLFTKKRKGIR